MYQCLLLLRKGILISSGCHDTGVVATMALRRPMPEARRRLLVWVPRLRWHGRAMVAVRVVVMRRHCAAGRPVGRDAMRLVAVVSTRAVSARGVASRG